MTIFEKKKKPYSSITYTTGDPELNIERFNSALDGNFTPVVEDSFNEAFTVIPNPSGGDSLYAARVGQRITLPPFIRLLTPETVNHFIKELEPEEDFLVGYVTPIYFYKDLADKFTLLKCTEFLGYTGVDYRDVRAETSADETAARIAKAKRDLADKEARGDKQLPSIYVNQTYDQVNKTVARKQDDQKNNLSTILFYPRQEKVKVKYFLDLFDGDGFFEVPRDILEETVYKKVQDLAYKKSAEVKAKVAEMLAIDGATLNDAIISNEDRYEYTVNSSVKKPHPRALYVQQIYFLKKASTVLGRSLMEAFHTKIGYKTLDEALQGISWKNTLKEGKRRQAKRYYIRPQNVFCATKTDILKALIAAGNTNCSVYSLKRIEDNEDVHKLLPKDIIYYYDNGILYDKNKVRVMDYNLFIKHEENRKKFSKDANDVSETEFNKAYNDRLTATARKDGNVKEALEQDNPFLLEYDDYNVYGERLIEGKVVDDICCICGEPIEGYGNNAAPIVDGRCCAGCNLKFIIPARIRALASNKDFDADGDTDETTEEIK